MITRKTERLIIRDPLPTDIDGWHRLISDPKTMYYLQDIMTCSLEESRANLDVAIEEAKNPNRTKYFFAVEHMKTRAFIGSIGYTVTQTTPVGKLVGIGYFILPEYHGKGYTTEALNEVLEFAFEDDNVYRVSTGCNGENKASERVMQKCWMKKEADLQSAVWHDGRLCNRVEYRLLRDEWVNRNSKSNPIKKELPDNLSFAVEKEPSHDSIEQLVTMVQAYAGEYFTDDFAENVRIDAPYQRLCYLKNENEIVSGIMFTVLDGSPHITVMATKKDYKGKGYGKRLMEHFGRYVLELGFHDIELYAWSEKTKPVCASTQSFYKSVGFTVTSEHMGLWAKDMITVKMKKSW